GRGRAPARGRPPGRGGRPGAGGRGGPERGVLRGNCHWPLAPAPTPARRWRAEEAIYWAQATYCQRRATECDPGHAAAWRYLAESYGARGMADAKLAAARRWLAADPRATEGEREQVERLGRAGERGHLPRVRPGRLPELVLQLIRNNRRGLAANLLEDQERRGRGDWPWPFAERVAGLYMHLGRPADARRVW